MDPAEISIQLKSKPELVCIVRSAAETAALACKMDPKAAGQIKLAVTEALANIMNHGYKGAVDGPIWVKLTIEEKHDRRGLHIQIEDECQGVDLSKIKSRPLDEVRPGGLGVHIMQQIMDTVEYQQRPAGRGICLRMSKYTEAPEQTD